MQHHQVLRGMALFMHDGGSGDELNDMKSKHHLNQWCHRTEPLQVVEVLLLMLLHAMRNVMGLVCVGTYLCVLSVCVYFSLSTNMMQNGTDKD